MLDLLEETCQECGCTEDNACWDEEDHLPCHWAAPGICSVCAKRVQGTEGETDVS